MKTYRIAYKEPGLIIVDKPQGLPTAPGKITDNLFDEVSLEFPEVKKIKGHRENEGGLLNRLDNETGGLVFIALIQESFDYYSTLMKNDDIIKIYHTIVEGIPSQSTGIIKTLIAHDSKKKMVCLSGNKSHRGHGRETVTTWKKIKSAGNRCLLEVIITKGARHQIRVHLAHIGHPIIGDKLYNRKKYPDVDCHQLYCTGTEFVSINGKKIVVNINPVFEL